jgi:urocanate hydratase
MGVIRHVDAGYELAETVAEQHDVKVPMRGDTAHPGPSR